MLPEEDKKIIEQAVKEDKLVEIWYTKVSGQKGRYEIIPVSYRIENDKEYLYFWDTKAQRIKRFLTSLISIVTPMQLDWPVTMDEMNCVVEIGAELSPTPESIELIEK